MSQFTKIIIRQQSAQFLSTKNWKTIWRGFVFAAAIMFLFLGSQQITRAADGDLDPSFGSGGKVITDFNNSTDYLNRIAVQPDGKIVAIGDTHPSHKGALARYNPDGTLDATFGNGGTVVNDFGQGLESYAIQLIIQPDGKLIIAGESSYEFLVARYNPNGTLDSTFGFGGYRLANFSSNWDGATDAVLQADG